MRTSRMVWFGLLQYFLMVQEQEGADFATRTVNFFSYFTILSNLLALAMSAPTLAPASPLGRHFATRAARTALNRLLGGRA